MFGVYVHIPFCKAKCAYCDFYSFKPGNDAIVFSYLSALRQEIKFAAKKFDKAKVSTIYIGGGTPSTLSENQLKSVINALGEFDLSNLEEFTVECNPESLTEEKLALMRELGVNRISIGVQSLSDLNLRSIRRLHNSQQATNALELSGKYFDNVSADLIIGLPYDDDELVESEIKELAQYVKHMSVYQLTLAENTPLFELAKKGKLLLPSDDEVAKFQHIAVSTLSDLGFERYEVSNFAKSGFKSKHNMAYWTGEEYIGIGAGAASFVKTKDGAERLQSPVRFSSPAQVNAYIGGINCVSAFDDVPRTDMEVISSSGEKLERIMLGLRTCNGVKKELVEGKISDDIKKYFVDKGENVALTEEGMEIMNTLLLRLLEF